MMVRADLGLAPWDVLHQGLSIHLPITIGQAVILTSIVVLVLWIPLRERPGVGTLANVALVGLSADLTLGLLARPDALWARIGLLACGVVLCGVATGLYIGAQFGPGARDGLMTGLARRTGWSLRLTRTGIEITVLVIGWLLGGSVGIGTVLFAVAIGPLAQWFLRRFLVHLPSP